jgi:hypothetical protein
MPMLEAGWPPQSIRSPHAERDDMARTQKIYFDVSGAV